MCEHKEFETLVAIIRLHKEGSEEIKDFLAEIKIRCKDCGQWFEFVGDMLVGMDLSKPTLSPDRIELRIPIKPAPPPKPREYIKHEIVDMDPNLMIQRCVICGEIISDYRNAAWPAEQGPPTGFSAGPIYVSQGQPKIYLKEMPDSIPYKNCK